MSAPIERLTTLVDVSIATSLSGCTSIDFRNAAGGQVYVPADSSLTTITWYGSPDGITFTPVQITQGGAAVAVPSKVAPSTTGCNQLIPAACFACAYVKGLGDAAETVVVSLKS